MFTTPAPAAPTLSTNTSAASPSSPTRGSRLRGLQYLRSYTHNHLHSHSTNSTEPTASLPPVTRARSTPAESTPTSRPRNSVARATVAEHLTNQDQRLVAPEASSIQRSSSPGSTGGWLPSVGLRSSLSRLSTGAESTATTREHPSIAERPLSTTSSSNNNSMTTMTRNRAETAAPVVPAARTATSQPATRTISAPDVHVHDAPSSTGTPISQLPTIRFIPHQDPRSNRPSLFFPPITRTLPSPSSIIRVGRYSERDSSSGLPHEPNPGHPSSQPVGFKSKVVSRRHCEFWCSNSQWYIKDVGSSSGTFLNHIRLSQPGVESKPYVVNDGDVVQLGIDFRGGEEMIFRCVKIRVECNRGWQKGLNNFNKSTHKRLRNLAKSQPKKDGDAASTTSSECSICLMSIAPCQSLFVAPCSHVWHYKCIRPILNGSTWPTFLCPNCRAVADLEADVEEDDINWSEDEDPEKDPDMKRAIEESLADASKPGGNARTNGEGGPIRSMDVTEARESRSSGLAPPADLDATTAGATAGKRSASGSRSRDHSAHSYGQGANDNIRTPRPQRSFRSAVSSTSQSSSRHQREVTATMDGDGDAELAALVAGMNFNTPARTPPPPPISTQIVDVTGTSASKPIPISAPARTNGEHSRKTSRHLDSAESIRRSGSVPPASSPVSLHRRNMDDGDGTVIDGLSIGPSGGIERRNTPNALSPLSAEEGGRRGSATEIGGPDCPMTPRNTVGPFILDGSGG